MLIHMINKLFIREKRNSYFSNLVFSYGQNIVAVAMVRHFYFQMALGAPLVSYMTISFT